MAYNSLDNVETRQRILKEVVSRRSSEERGLADQFGDTDSIEYS